MESKIFKGKGGWALKKKRWGEGVFSIRGEIRGRAGKVRKKRGSKKGSDITRGGNGRLEVFEETPRSKAMSKRGGKKLKPLIQ